MHCCHCFSCAVSVPERCPSPAAACKIVSGSILHLVPFIKMEVAANLRPAGGAPIGPDKLPEASRLVTNSTGSPAPSRASVTDEPHGLQAQPARSDRQRSTASEMALRSSAISDESGQRLPADGMPPASATGPLTASSFRAGPQHRASVSAKVDARSRPMQVLVQPQRGESFVLWVHGSDTVSSVKVRLQDKLAIPPEQQRLTVAGRDLAHNSTLEANSIGNDDTIQILGSLHGGMDNDSTGPDDAEDMIEQVCDTCNVSRAVAIRCLKGARWAIDDAITEGLSTVEHSEPVEPADSAAQFQSEDAAASADTAARRAAAIAALVAGQEEAGGTAASSLAPDAELVELAGVGASSVAEPAKGLIVFGASKAGSGPFESSFSTSMEAEADDDGGPAGPSAPASAVPKAAAGGEILGAAQAGASGSMPAAPFGGKPAGPIGSFGAKAASGGGIFGARPASGRSLLGFGEASTETARPALAAFLSGAADGAGKPAESAAKLAEQAGAGAEKKLAFSFGQTTKAALPPPPPAATGGADYNSGPGTSATPAGGFAFGGAIKSPGAGPRDPSTHTHTPCGERRCGHEGKERERMSVGGSGLSRQMLIAKCSSYIDSLLCRYRRRAATRRKGSPGCCGARKFRWGGQAARFQWWYC